MIRLTDEQRKLAEENMDLVRYVISRYIGKKLVHDEDLVSTGYIGLCNAAAAYDEKKDLRFSTFAVKCIFNEICQATRYHNAFRRTAQNEAYSLNRQIETTSGEVVEMIDLIVDPKQDTERTALNNIMCESVASYIPTCIEKERGNYTYEELAKLRGVSRSRAHQKVKSELIKARDKLNTHRSTWRKS